MGDKPNSSSEEPPEAQDVNNGAAGTSRSTQTPNTTDAAAMPTLVDYLAENMHLIVGEKMYAVIPLRDCPHLTCVQPVPAGGINVNIPCMECSGTAENWVCLTCYKVGCGRYGQKHMQEHGENTGHPLALGFADLSVWCYECEAYVDNKVLYPAKNSAHMNKFEAEMPWSYGSQ